MYLNSLLISIDNLFYLKYTRFACNFPIHKLRLKEKKYRNLYKIL